MPPNGSQPCFGSCNQSPAALKRALPAFAQSVDRNGLQPANWSAFRPICVGVVSLPGCASSRTTGHSVPCTSYPHNRVMHTVISDILGRCGTQTSVLPPTQLYNEGWLLRLVLDWLDRHRGFAHPLSFLPGARWYSEALLASRFLPRTRGDKLAEAFTHADGVVGHFDIDPGLRGDARIQAGASQFVVLEAKLGSALASGTKNAPGFDQAARNVACIAHLLAAVDVSPDSVQRLGFYVLAPWSQIKAGVFSDLVTKSSVRAKVQARAGAYAGEHDAWVEKWFMPTLEHIDVDALSWEDVLAALPPSESVESIRTFYEECLRFNLPPSGRTESIPTSPAVESDR